MFYAPFDWIDKSAKLIILARSDLSELSPVADIILPPNFM
jgi:hypothetical protein